MKNLYTFFSGLVNQLDPAFGFTIAVLCCGMMLGLCRIKFEGAAWAWVKVGSMLIVWMVLSVSVPATVKWFSLNSTPPVSSSVTLGGSSAANANAIHVLPAMPQPSNSVNNSSALYLTVIAIVLTVVGAIAITALRDARDQVHKAKAELLDSKKSWRKERKRLREAVKAITRKSENFASETTADLHNARADIEKIRLDALRMHLYMQKMHWAKNTAAEEVKRQIKYTADLYLYTHEQEEFSSHLRTAIQRFEDIKQYFKESDAEYWSLLLQSNVSDGLGADTLKNISKVEQACRETRA